MDRTDWNTQKQELKEKKIAKITRVVISTLLALAGILLLGSQLFPLAGSFIQGKIYEIKAGILAAPIPDSHKEYIKGELAYYNPGQSYFANLFAKATGQDQTGTQTFDPITKKLKPVVVDKEYSKDMQLTISDIGIKNIKISSNVESRDEAVYNLYLKTGLAHFKGTPLPGDGGNAFIYGHSAVPSFFTSHRDLAETIFSRLENIDVGSEVIVKKDGKDLKYIVRNKKIVEPSDFSVLQSTGDKETLTMMTCWPLGIPSKRLIVLAERYE
jgi:LPXTG-site transpeptidase (sortase) family protein